MAAETVAGNFKPARYYCGYMKSVVLKVSRIGNSRGIRLPVKMLRKYHITNTVVAEEKSAEIVLRAGRPAPQKLSWEETARAMAATNEDWSEWDITLADGLDEIPWDGGPPGKRAVKRKKRHGKG